MAETHINQAIHNYDFLKKLDTFIPIDFFDWKITVTFYCALHIMRAFTKFIGKSIINEHKQFNIDINPTEKNILGLTKKAYDSYIELYRASIRTRYSGFFMQKSNLLALYNVEYGFAKTNLESVAKFTNSKGMLFKLDSTSK